MLILKNNQNKQLDRNIKNVFHKKYACILDQKNSTHSHTFSHTLIHGTISEVSLTDQDQSYGWANGAIQKQSNLYIFLINSKSQNNGSKKY